MLLLMPGNMAVEQYRLQRLIWELNYIRILDLYIMITSCNINFNGYSTSDYEYIAGYHAWDGEIYKKDETD